jgi:hypothetical protein
MSETLTMTDVEATICTISHLIEEDKLYFVQMAGPPLMALLLAKRLRVPGVGYVVEEGAVAPNPSFPLPRMMLGASRSHYRAVQWTGMNIVDAHAALGYMDYGLLAALQVDKYGNFNSTFIGGTYEAPERRFGGPGGANEIASQCWRTLIMTKQQKRKFVERVDFRTSLPGRSPGARERRPAADRPLPHHHRPGPVRLRGEDAPDAAQGCPALDDGGGCAEQDGLRAAHRRQAGGGGPAHAAGARYHPGGDRPRRLQHQQRRVVHHRRRTGRKVGWGDLPQ